MTKEVTKEITKRECVSSHGNIVRWYRISVMEERMQRRSEGAYRSQEMTAAMNRGI